MTEQEWLTCRDANVMLNFLRDKASDRKLRLFAVACCRRLWHLPLEVMDPDEGRWIASIRDAVRVGERLADGQATREELQAAALLDGCGVEILYAFIGCSGPVEELSEVTRNVIDAVGEYAFAEASHNPSLMPAQYGAAAIAAQEAERAAQSLYLREIFGNPFRPVAIDPAWLIWHDGLLVSLGRRMYDERAFHRLPILADALEEAGCTNADMLNHCRQPGEHVRGCWVVDLLLGKS